MKEIITSLLAIALFLVAAPLAHAQTQGVEIKPGIVEDRVNPGDVFRFTLSVKNLAPDERTYYVLLEDILGVNDEGLPVFAEAGQATGYEISEWIQPETTSVTLGSNETRSVAFTVRVPLEATPGSHFGGVFFAATPPGPGETGAAVGIQVGSVISLRISGDIIEEARLREFSSGSSVYSTPNVDFTVRVENMSNVLVRPRGTIEITNMRGKQVAVVRVNDSGGAIFPETERIYRPVWDSESFAFGRYQAVLSLAYGEDSRKTISGVATFWVLPAQLILTILGSLFAAALLLFLFVRSYIRRKLRDMGISGSKEYIGARHERSALRMMAIVAVLFLVAIVCLGFLFFMFA
jgi:hypothetical protein